MGRFILLADMIRDHNDLFSRSTTINSYISRYNLRSYWISTLLTIFILTYSKLLLKCRLITLPTRMITKLFSKSKVSLHIMPKPFIKQNVDWKKTVAINQGFAVTVNSLPCTSDNEYQYTGKAVINALKHWTKILVLTYYRF